jgi:uncharacterized repeat protein (TIGR03803 family)
VSEARPQFVRGWPCALILVALLSLGRANAQVEFQLVHAFGAPGDGQGLGSAVIIDANGDLFGTAGGGAYGQGMVYELRPGNSGTWTETIPHSFGAPHSGDGTDPYGPVTLGAGGVLYGATPGGGADNQGIVYSLTPNPSGWAETILYSFLRSDSVDGFSSNLALDEQGNLYGRAGTFELSPGPNGWIYTPTCNWKFICTFNEYQGTALGPGHRLLAAGGLGANHMGNVYAVVPSARGWSAGPLYAFGSIPNDGQVPSNGPLVADAQENIYGTTLQGGSNVCGDIGCGTIYKLTRGPNGIWQETILYSFRPPASGTGYAPIAGVILDKSGNLYGTTSAGGADCGCGVVYRLTHHEDDTWTFVVLHRFVNTDGALPYASVTLDRHGNLFGTTLGGGPNGGGVVFEISRASDGTR